jgi:DNA-binding SARP family transcriptional activator
MTLHQLVDKSYQKLMQQMQDTRIILLHPHSRYRSVVVARLVNEPNLETFYYAMGPDDINLRSFITGITQCLSSQFPMFGRYINILPQDVYTHPEDHFDLVLKTFIKDLTQITTNDFILILDEYDRSDKSDDVQKFVESLSSNLPENCRIIINSRTLPRLPWVAMIAQKRAIMLLDDEIVKSDFYGMSKKDDEPTMEVFGLGPGFVLSNGEMITNWEGHLPRLLFFFALDRPVVTRSEICQAFWPDLASDQAVNVFHVTKRRLHKALGTDMLIHNNGYYQINTELNIYYDVMDFVSTLMYARNETNVDKRMNAWERIGDLYRGEFLQGHHDDWILKRRAEFLDGYLESLVGLAGLWNESGRYEQALSLYIKAVNANYDREDLHRGILQHYNLLGRRSELAAHYKKLASHMKQSKRQISEETDALYKELMA